MIHRQLGGVAVVRRGIGLCLFGFAVHASQTPDWISFAGGVYDILRPKHQTAEIEIEYKFHVRKWTSPFDFLEFVPLVGVMATVRGSGYLYAGLNFDFLILERVVLSPGFAAGYYWQGGGKDLGFPLEFRSGVELGWQFADFRRLGVHFYHLSNASLGRRNPGEESFVIYYDIPIKSGFPFIR